MSQIKNCQSCGLLYVLPEDKNFHNSFHRQFFKAIDKFGFCYSHREQESMKRQAYRVIYSERIISTEKVLQAFELLFKAYFSRSLRGSRFSLRHPAYKTYVAMLLNQNHWKKYLLPFPEAYEILLKKYGTHPGLGEGLTYYKLLKTQKKAGGG